MELELLCFMIVSSVCLFIILLAPALLQLALLNVFYIAMGRYGEQFPGRFRHT